MTSSADSEFDIRTPFLHQCLAFLAEEARAGGAPFFPTDSGMREHITLFYHPSLPHGVPSFDLLNNEWHFFGNSQDEANLRLEISGDGHFLVGEGDDDGVFIDLQIEAPEEIGEVLALVGSLTESIAADTERRIIALSDIIKSIGICVPQNGSNEWSTIQSADIERLHSDGTRILEAFFHQAQSDWDYLVDIGFRGWIAWFREASKASAAVSTRPITSGTLIFTKTRGLCTYRRWLALGEIYKDTEPALTLELDRAVCSLMYFTDYINKAAEGKGITEGLLNSWKDPWGFLNTKRIELPVSVVCQLRTSAELRSAKWQYKQQFDRLMNEREPIAQIVKLYRRRIRDIEFVHSEYLEEIQIAKQPLPFPIEYPYRRFRRVEELVQQIRYAQHLLNVVLKSVYYFALAEVAGTSAEIAAQSRKRLGPTPTDGRLLNEVLVLKKTIDEHRLSLPVFGPLITAVCGDQIAALQGLVDVRNRFHHPPYLEKEFVSVAKDVFPQVSETFRTALRGIEFVLPESYRFAEQKRIIKVRIVSGYDSDFPSRDLETSLPFESFPTGELIAVNGDGRTAVRLSEFFSVKLIEGKIADIGVLDRREKDTGELVYTFTRDET
jgi:hypothetical protein